MTGISRRTALRAIGATGVGGAVTSSIVMADDDPETPFCDNCPDGTDLLAKYNYEQDDDGNWYFDYEGGECDVVDLAVEEYKDGDPSEPTKVSFTSDLFYQGLRVKTGNGSGDDCDSVSRESVATDDNEKDGMYEGVVDLSKEEIDEVDAISYLAFCAASCFQVDFAFGDPIEDLGDDDNDDGFYSKRKLVHKFGNTHTLQTSGTQGGTHKYQGCTVTTSPVQVDLETNEATVTFTLDKVTDSCTLSLVSYVAPCPIGFTSETADRQHVLDATKKTYYEDDQGKTITFEGDLDVVQLPTAEHLDSICAGDGHT